MVAVDHGFPTTEWSLVLSAAKDPGAEPHEALARLCEAYWFPLYAYVRRRGYSTEDAQDVVQLYFLRLIETRFIDAAKPHAGRFRAFLLHTMKQFLIDRKRREQAARRGGGQLPIRIDSAAAESRVGAAISDRTTPEDEYERQWALAVVDRTLDTLERDAADRGREREFRALSPYLTEGGPRRTYREVADELGMSEGAVKVAVLRLRRRFGRALREMVGQTLADPAGIDQEIRRLLAALSS